MRPIALKLAHREGWMLAALMVSVALSMLDVNFTSVALPSMRDYFGVSVEQAVWVSTAYFIPLVVLMPLQANLGQRWGLRRMYALGLAGYSAGAFLVALAPAFGWLLFSRVLQGMGWSALYPVALILIRSHFPGGRQGEVMGIWESAAGAAAIVGPFLGGSLVAFLGWQAVYVTLGTLAGLGALLATVTIPPRSVRPALPAFDWPGALSLTLALLLLLLGVTRKAPFLLLAGGLVFLVWLWLARRPARPFISPNIFGNRRFVSASTVATLRMVIGMAAIMSLPLFLEDIQGLSPAVVGMFLPIYSIFLFLGARPGGRWSDRSGGRQPSVAGFFLITVGVALLMLLDVRLNLIIIAAALAIRGLGAGLAQSPPAQVATGAVEPEQTSMAAGLYSMLRYSGLALGAALVGILLQARLAHYGSDGSGPGAVLAFHALFAVLTVLGLVGFAVDWLIGRRGRVFDQEGVILVAT